MGLLTERDFLVLSEVSFLRTLSDRDVRRWMAGCSVNTYRQGASLFTEGEASESLFVVLQGEIEIFVAREGVDVPLDRIRTGAFFGEQALLRGPPFYRTAGARATAPSRLVEIDRDRFTELLALPTNSALRMTLVGKGDIELYTRLVRSLTVFRGLDARMTLADGVSRVEVSDGEVVIHEGDEADAAYFVLEGKALVTKHHRGQDIELSRLGRGQCFGELALLEHAPRAATVRAEGALTLIRVNAALFLKWVNRVPELRDFLHTLRQVYRSASGGVVTVHRGVHEGMECITSVRQQQDGSCLMATKVHGRDLFSLSRTRSGDEMPTRIVIHSRPDSPIKRTLHISSNCLVGLVSEGPWRRLGECYQAVADLSSVSPEDISRFEATGELFEEQQEGGDEPICYCMQLGKVDLRRRLNTDCNSVYELMEATGAGSICGGCHTELTELHAASAGPFGPKRSE